MSFFHSFKFGLQKNALFAFCRFLVRRFNEAQISHISGSLTFTSLLALVPMLTVALAILTALPAFSDLADSFTELVHDFIVPSGASAVVSYLHEFKNQAGKMTAIGIGLMVLTSLLLLQTVEQAFNRIWHIRRPRSLWVKLPAYWALLTLGPALIGLSLSVSAYFSKNALFAANYPFLQPFLIFVWRVGLDALVLFLLYKLVPNRLVAYRHALLGALFTALLLEMAKWLFALYIANFNSYQLIYGAFAAIPIFLLWLYLLWSIVLGGALLTANLSYWNHAAYLSAGNHSDRFNRILHILTLLEQAQRNGRSLSWSQLCQQTPIGDDELHDLLEQLEQAGIVCSSSRHWLLKTLPSHIHLKTLFVQFIHNPNASTSPIQPCMLPDLQSLDISLQQWLSDQQKST